MHSLSAAPEAVDVDRHLELGATRTSARPEDVDLVLQAAAATGDAGGQDPAGGPHGRTREPTVQQGGVHGRAGGVAAHHVAPHVPAPVGVERDHAVGRARGTHLLAAPVEAADVEFALRTEANAGAGASRGAVVLPEAGVDAQAQGAVAARPAATSALGIRVGHARGRGALAHDGARDGAARAAGGAGGARAGAGRGHTARAREDAGPAETPVLADLEPLAGGAGGAGAGGEGAGPVLGAGVAAARALGTGGRDARGDAPLAHDRAGDGAARAGRGAGVAGAGAGVRRGRAGEAIAVAHPVTVTLPPTRLTAGAHATRRGVGDGARDAPDARATVRLGAARRAPPQVDARGDQDLAGDTVAADRLTHPPVGRAGGTDRHHPRRGGGRRHARVLRPRRELPVRDALADGPPAARQAAQAGAVVPLAALDATGRADRGRSDGALATGPGVRDDHRGVAAAREGDGGHREQEGGHDRGEHPRGRNDLLHVHDQTPWGYEPRER